MDIFKKLFFLIVFGLIINCRAKSKQEQEAEDVAKIYAKAFADELSNIGTKVGTGLFKGIVESLTDDKQMDETAKKLKNVQKKMVNNSIDGMKEIAHERSEEVSQEVAGLVSDSMNKAIGEGSKFKLNAETLRDTWINFLGIGGLKLGVYGAFALIPGLVIKYIYHYFIKKLNDPRIIIETSIGSWPYELQKRLLRFKPRKPKERLEHMILAPETKEHIQEVIAFIKANLKEGKSLGNLLLTGHPGNGKTYLAKALAAEFGMDYIILTGSSFFQENAGVKAIDQIFAKMTKGRKVIIFIDEIETLIGSRTGKSSDGDAYRFTNQLLNYTSEPNENFILVGATNHSSLIDPAFHRRFQYVVEMPLPAGEQRKEALMFFRNKQLINKKNKEQVLKIFSDARINAISQMTDGLSFAELQTIIDYIRSAMCISKIGITKKIIDNAVSRVLNKEKTFNKVFLKK